MELWARNGRELLPKVKHDMGFASPPKEGVLRIFSPEKSDGFGRL
jgi:hypothetical protein